MHFVKRPEIQLIYLRPALLIHPVCPNNLRGHIGLRSEWVSINKWQAGGAVSKVKHVENSTTAQVHFDILYRVKMKGRWKRDWGMCHSGSTWWNGSGLVLLPRFLLHVSLWDIYHNLNALSKLPVHHSLIQFAWFGSVSLSNRPSSFLSPAIEGDERKGLRERIDGNQEMAIIRIICC